MRYAVIIVAAAFLFTALGLAGAWGAVAYAFPDRPASSSDRDTVLFTFFGMSSAGFVAGCAVGLAAAYALAWSERRGRPAQL